MKKERNKVLTIIKDNINFRRIVDIIVGLIGCLLLIPLTIVIWILRNILKEKGSIFYHQNRIGKNGKLFKLYKYRSMIIGAEEELEKILQENEKLRKEYKEYKKLKNDPRVTKLGNFIRRTNIDEFPQFINILKGDMTLIGPRPYLENEIDDMKDTYEIIKLYKPGLTGLWQVNQEKQGEFENRIKTDVKYINEKSLKKDIKIALKTIKNIIKNIYVFLFYKY